MASSAGAPVPLSLSINPAIRTFLTSAAADTLLNEEARTTASDLASQQTIPWQTLKALTSTWRDCHGGAGPSLKSLCKGSQLQCAPPSPSHRPPNPALAKILAERRRLVESRAYDAMVADVTATERKAGESKDLMVVSFKHQIAFAAHILTLMATFFGLGYWLAQYVTDSMAVRAMVGVLGMVAAMVLETALFVVRQMAMERPVPKALRRDYAAAARRAALPPKRGLWAWLQGGRGRGRAPVRSEAPGGAVPMGGGTSPRDGAASQEGKKTK